MLSCDDPHTLSLVNLGSRNPWCDECVGTLCTRSLYCWNDCPANAWGLSDKAGKAKLRGANMGLSSGMIQFHSLNIDVLPLPASGLNMPTGC